MRYGHFDDAAKEYVIETPATPLPWINYLGNKDFFSLISNTGGGYSFYKDAKLRRVTRYRYNNVPADNGSRCYYLSLMDSDSADAKPVETWSPTFLPCKTPLDSYKCRQGIGYTVFQARHRIQAHRLRAAAHQCGNQSARRDEHHRRAGRHRRDRLRGMVPVECRGRLVQLPAQPVHRRGGDRTRNRCHAAVPQDRIQGAPQPLRVLRRQRARRRFRHQPRRVPRPVQRLGHPAGHRRRQGSRFRGARLVPDRRQPRASGTPAGRNRIARVHAGLYRSGQGPEMGGSERSGQGRHHKQEAGP